MEIIILLTILLIVVLLGGLSSQVGMMCFHDPELMIDPLTININLPDSLLNLAEKLTIKGLYMLIIVAAYSSSNWTQITLIYTIFKVLEG